MSLKYSFPINSALGPNDLELRRLPMLREAKKIVYNGLADVDDFLEELEGVPYCKVVGPTGVGKSSILPKVVAERLGKTVLVVTGHPLLALQGYALFKRNPRFGVDSAALKGTVFRTDTDVNMELSDYDIVWISAPHLIAWIWARLDRMANGGILSNMVLFLDEAHEADAYTHVVRTVTPHLGLDTLLMVSATFEPTGHTIPPKVEVIAYDAIDVPKYWDVNDDDKPWSVKSLRNSALIYIDNQYDAVRLVEDYDRAGMSAFRLHARSTVEDYLTAAAELEDPNAPPTVLIVDSSFRSGFNFDVQTIIDSGTRYLADGTVGVQATFKRPIYNVEFTQTAGRGGRFSQKTYYYKPDMEPAWRMCDLEPVEAEAAALITRRLGFMPTGTLSNTVLASEDLPPTVDTVEALNGDKPLTCYIRDSSGERLPNPNFVDKSRIRAKSRHRRPSTILQETAIIDSPKPKSIPLTKHTLRELEERTKGLSVSGRTPMIPTTTILPRDSASHYTHGDSVRQVVTEREPEDTLEFSDSTSPDRFEERKEDPAIEDVWTQIQQAIISDNNESLNLGDYFFSPDVDSTDILDNSKYFPDKERSVYDLNMEGKLDRYLDGLASKHIKFALYHCIKRYNLLNLEVNTVRRAMTTILKTRQGIQFNNTLKGQFSSVMDRHIKWEMERKTLFKILNLFSNHGYTVVRIKEFDRMEKDHYIRNLETFTHIIDTHISRKPVITDWIGHHRSSSDGPGVFRPAMLTEGLDPGRQRTLSALPRPIIQDSPGSTIRTPTSNIRTLSSRDGDTKYKSRRETYNH